MGAEHVVARDGAEAVEQARRHQPDLILMDVSMPVLNGHGATRAIRALEGDRRPRIVGLTAHAMAEDRLACLQSGMDDHLAKPLSIPQLKRVVREAAAARTTPGDGTLPLSA